MSQFTRFSDPFGGLVRQRDLSEDLSASGALDSFDQEDLSRNWMEAFWPHSGGSFCLTAVRDPIIRTLNHARLNRCRAEFEQGANRETESLVQMRQVSDGRHP